MRGARGVIPKQGGGVNDRLMREERRDDRTSGLSLFNWTVILSDKVHSCANAGEPRGRYALLRSAQHAIFGA